MAVTISRYNHTADLFLGGDITLATLKVMLLDANAVFDATDATLADVLAGAATEVSGNGWDVGGETLAGVTVTVVATSGAMIDATDLSVTAVGGNIGPTNAAVIYDDTLAGDPPLWYIDFDGAKEVDVGSDFKILFHASGISRVT